MRVPRFRWRMALHTGKAYNIEPGVQTAVAAAPETASVRVWQITSRIKRTARLVITPDPGKLMTEPTDRAVLLQGVSELLIQSLCPARIPALPSTIPQ